MIIRRKCVVVGQVQGVGFRPFVYTLAISLDLTGSVSNTREGVFIEIQGSENNIEKFKTRLFDELPPLAEILSYKEEECPLVDDEKEFQIVITDSHGKGHSVRISPDVAHCEACKNEMLDKENKRYLYPFINCTHCGPRFSITHSMPYDRVTTSMSCFPLCEKCKEEYTNPLDRRFHAQPTACHICGVKIWTEEGFENFDAIKITLQKLHEGKILAIKGLGGFHLACDAMNIKAIENLRERKNRPSKAFAIMVKNIDKARDIAYIDEIEEELLTSRQRPIVICKRKENILPDILSPDTKTIGIMLPSTPLHELFFNAEHFDEKNFEALVMTSGNPAGEPICLKNREARDKLADFVDGFLFHNRDILVRVDDSVLFAKPQHIRIDEKDSFVSIRRARGYVPTPVSLPIDFEKPCSKKQNILAFGADLKNTCCITRTNEEKIEAIVGQHVGDMASIKNQDFLLETIEHLTKIYDVEPKVVVADAHPNAYSHLLAEEYASARNLPCITLQHHAAHAFALLADNSYANPCIVIVLDGTGYGLDNTMWGGELLYIDPQKGEWKRVGHFSKVFQPANDRAVENPWYMTQSYLQSIGLSYFIESVDKDEQGIIYELCEKNMGIQTSSCGRLFDAVGVLLACNPIISYEGQVAMQLEAKQDENFNEFDMIDSYLDDNNILIFDNLKLFKNCVERKMNKQSDSEIARYFHLSLAHSLVDWARKACEIYGVNSVGMTGGVFLNKTLIREVSQELTNISIKPLLHKNFSPSDASLSLGQAFYGSLK